MTSASDPVTKALTLCFVLQQPMDEEALDDMRRLGPTQVESFEVAQQALTFGQFLVQLTATDPRPEALLNFSTHWNLWFINFIRLEKESRKWQKPL